jgi:hypothetical protein
MELFLHSLLRLHRVYMASNGRIGKDLEGSDPGIIWGELRNTTRTSVRIALVSVEIRTASSKQVQNQMQVTIQAHLRVLHRPRGVSVLTRPLSERIPY